jgi:CIC family chloride channel protein
MDRDVREKTQAQGEALSIVGFSLAASLVGITAGLGALVFRGLIALFHNLLFLGRLSFSYDANVHTPASPWGPLVVLVPVLGALGVVFLVDNFAPETEGPGVAAVMDAIYYDKGLIRPVVAAVKMVASALSIGSGGSVGREGPTIQVGSSLASTVAQLASMAPWQRITLVAAGGAAGIAATFNAPIGGILFAVEILLPEVSAKTLIPVALAAATATYTGRLFFGVHPSFVIPSLEIPYFHATKPLILLSYVVFGLTLGCVSIVLIKSVFYLEEFFDRWLGDHYYVRHTLGTFLVGLMAYLSLAVWGHYYITGVGYATIQDILSGVQLPLYLLLLLSLLKLVATSLTLGSGASGGIFSPALFVGATLGAAYGVAVNHLIPEFGVTPAAFAVAGMAGVVGGTTGAAITAAVMIFEMTLDYSVIVPMTLTVALSYGVRRVLSRDSIYTQKLVQLGHDVPRALRATVLHWKKARDVMDTDPMTVPAWYTLEDYVQNWGQATERWCLVKGGSRIVGVVDPTVVLDRLERNGGEITVGEIASRDYLTVAEDISLFQLIVEMHAQNLSAALVFRDARDAAVGDLQGLITRQQLIDSVAQVLEFFSE